MLHNKLQLKQLPFLLCTQCISHGQTDLFHQCVKAIGSIIAKYDDGLSGINATNDLRLITWVVAVVPDDPSQNLINGEIPTKAIWRKSSIIESHRLKGLGEDGVGDQYRSIQSLIPFEKVSGGGADPTGAFTFSKPNGVVTLWE